MVGIDIQSLFADIIQSPGQRRQSLTAQGERDAVTATRGLTGRSQIFAPLVGALASSQGMRDEMLQRSVGGLFGLDTRNESEKLQQVMQGADTKTPEGQAAMLQGLKDIGMADKAVQLEQMFAAQAMALEDRERAEELRIASLTSRELGDKLTSLELESTQQQMEIRAAGLEAEEEKRALEETARQAAVARQEALATWFTGKDNEDLAGLARAGVVTPSNLDSFVVDNKPIVLREGDILTRPNGTVIVSNPKTKEVITKDYSLTKPEIEAYTAIIETEADIQEALQTPRRFWRGTYTDENKMLILIDEAERIRTQNPELSREAALRQAIAPETFPTPEQGQPVTEISTPEEYENLPSGPYRVRTDPPGVQRIKP